MHCLYKQSIFHASLFFHKMKLKIQMNTVHEQTAKQQILPYELHILYRIMLSRTQFPIKHNSESLPQCFNHTSFLIYIYPGFSKDNRFQTLLLPVYIYAKNPLCSFLKLLVMRQTPTPLLYMYDSLDY